MSEKLLDQISKCSEKSKRNISEFFRELLSKKEEKEKKNEVISQLVKVFNKYTANYSLKRGRDVSKEERNSKLLTDHQFNYGQIDFETIEKIFHKISSIRDPKKQQYFYDLGSGTGKVVFAASICYPFTQCIGIEFLETLCNFSLTLKNNLQKNQKEVEQDLHEIGNKISFLPHIEFINGDFKNVNWSDGTIIFVSSTCYSRQVMDEIEKLCFKLEAGTIIVTLTRKLKEVDGIRLIDSFEGSTSWGVSTVYIHIKY